MASDGQSSVPREIYAQQGIRWQQEAGKPCPPPHIVMVLPLDVKLSYVTCLIGNKTAWCFSFLIRMGMLVAQLCSTLYNPMNCRPPGSSVHVTSQARILEWVAMLSSRGSSQPRDWTRVSHTAVRFFTIWAPREALLWMLTLQMIHHYY